VFTKISNTNNCYEVQCHRQRRPQSDLRRHRTPGRMKPQIQQRDAAAPARLRRRFRQSQPKSTCPSRQSLAERWFRDHQNETGAVKPTYTADSRRMTKQTTDVRMYEWKINKHRRGSSRTDTRTYTAMDRFGGNWCSL